MAGGSLSAALRPAVVDDAAALAGVHVSAWRETYGGLLPDAMLAAMSVESRAAMWQRMLSRPAEFATTRAYLATAEDGTVVAFGACCHQRAPALAASGFTGEIAAIYVLRSAQRQRAGSGLMRVMATDLLARGFAGGSLWVLADNGDARRFYERLGGVVVAEKSETLWGMLLQEVAYGWPDLTVLLADD